MLPAPWKIQLIFLDMPLLNLFLLGDLWGYGIPVPCPCWVILPHSSFVVAGFVYMCLGQLLTIPYQMSAEVVLSLWVQGLESSWSLHGFHEVFFLEPVWYYVVSIYLWHIWVPLFFLVCWGGYGLCVIWDYMWFTLGWRPFWLPCLEWYAPCWVHPWRWFRGNLWVHLCGIHPNRWCKFIILWRNCVCWWFCLWWGDHVESLSELF